MEEEKPLNKSVSLCKQDSEIANWIRHFDILLWTVTTILATAIGGLYLFCLNEFKFEPSLFGFFLTIIAVHFASSTMLS